MNKVFTAAFLLLILIAFQNCSGKNSNGQTDQNDTLAGGIGRFKVESTTAITADTVLVKEFGNRTELRMNKDELAIYFSDRITPPRFCNLAANAEYQELKHLLLAQKVCYFKSTVTEAEKEARGSRCVIMDLGWDPGGFTVFTYKPGEASQALTNVSSRSSWLEGIDPFCLSDFTAFCSDTDNERITQLAQSLAGQISTLNNCYDDTIVKPASAE